MSNPPNFIMSPDAWGVIPYWFMLPEYKPKFFGGLLKIFCKYVEEFSKIKDEKLPEKCLVCGNPLHLDIRWEFVYFRLRSEDNKFVLQNQWIVCYPHIIGHTMCQVDVIYEPNPEPHFDIYKVGSPK